MKEKLVLLIPKLGYGGAERVVSRLSFLLKDLYDVNIVVFSDLDITYDVGCDITSLKININKNIISSFFQSLKGIISYHRYKKKNNIDITYSFGDQANLINILSLYKDKKIISIRGYNRIRFSKSIKDKLILRPITKLIYHKANSIVSVSELISLTIANEYKIPKDKIKTCHNGYEIKKIIDLSKEAVNSTTFNKLNLHRTIVTAGTFRKEKGYWHLLKAFSLVLKSEKDVKLLILGNDSNGYKEKVQILADQLGIKESVIYGGYQKNPYSFFSKCKMYVLPSTSEGFPNAMVEAMVCGLPIIASDCKSGPREILNKEFNIEYKIDTYELCDYGILVKAMDKQENFDSNTIQECDYQFANAMLLLLKDDNLRTFYASKAYERSTEFNDLNWLQRQIKIISN